MAALELLGISGKMILLQMVPFVVVLVGLYFIIFKPMLTMLSEREKNIHGFRKEAELLQEEVSAKLAELEGRLADARAEASVELARLRSEAQSAEQEILAAARQRADVLLEEARKEIAIERAAAEAQIEATLGDLSQRIAGRVLGRQLSGGDN